MLFCYQFLLQKIKDNFFSLNAKLSKVTCKYFTILQELKNTFKIFEVFLLKLSYILKSLWEVKKF